MEIEIEKIKEKLTENKISSYDEYKRMIYLQSTNLAQDYFNEYFYNLQNTTSFLANCVRQFMTAGSQYIILTDFNETGIKKDYLGTDSRLVEANKYLEDEHGGILRINELVEQFDKNKFTEKFTEGFLKGWTLKSKNYWWFKMNGFVPVIYKGVQIILTKKGYFIQSFQ